jgi:hypothetical protein
MGHAGEVLELYQLGLSRMLSGHFVQDLMHRQQVFVSVRCRGVESIQIHTPVPSTVPFGSFAPGPVYQNTSHCLAGGMKEVRATAESGIPISDQSNPRFMDQRRGLKRLTRKFPSQLDGRIAPQFRVQEDKQILRSPGFAALHGL